MTPYRLLLLGLAAVWLAVAPVEISRSARLTGPAVSGPAAPVRPAPLPDDYALPLGVGVAIVIRKDIGTIAKKFSARASSASTDYSSGVQGAGGDWQANASAAGDNWAQGVNQAVADKRYTRGIDGAAAAKYTHNATTLGPQRYQQGVQNAEGAYQRGVEPFLTALKSTDLPPRGPKGSQQNMDRANKVATRLRSLKIGKA